MRTQCEIETRGMTKMLNGPTNKINAYDCNIAGVQFPVHRIDPQRPQAVTGHVLNFPIHVNETIVLFVRTQSRSDI